MTAIVVVGAGVVGLTAALRLLEDGHDVEVWTKDDPESTVSAVAAAIWFPYAAGPRDAVLRWSALARTRFEALYAVPDSGVTPCEGLLVVRAATEPWWRPLLPDWRAAPHERVPAGAIAADVATLPVAEMPVFLAWLQREITRRGGRVVRRSIVSIDDAFALHDVVVLCTGLASRELVPDASVHPIRGQVVVVDRRTTTFVLDDDHPDGMTYVIPRSHDCVLGGTHGAHDEDRAPRAAETEAIRARCVDLVPALDAARTRQVKVGLRPGRPTVRVEAEHVTTARGRGLLVHDYGHGGSGMTLSFGCAEDVARLVREHAPA